MAVMKITERDLQILKHLRRYKFLVTKQIRSLCFPNDKDGSVARDRLRKLEKHGLVQRRRAEVANPFSSNTMPVWLPTEDGCSALALECNDTSWLLDIPPSTRAWQNFAHYACVSDFHIQLDQAITQQNRVVLPELIFEHDLLDNAKHDASEKFRLNTIVQTSPRKIVCAPDSAFELQVDSYRRAYYVELERGSDTPVRAIAKKHQGYFHLNQTEKYKLHFPQAQDMRVLFIAPTSSWRDALKKAAADKPGAELYLFLSLEDVSPDSILHGEIVYSCTDGPKPLVRPQVAPAQCKAQEEVQEL